MKDNSIASSNPTYLPAQWWTEDQGLAKQKRNPSTHSNWIVVGHRTYTALITVRPRAFVRITGKEALCVTIC